MSSNDKVAQIWGSLSIKVRDGIAKKYGYSNGRTIDRWVKKEEVGRLRLLKLILKEEGLIN